MASRLIVSVSSTIDSTKTTTSGSYGNSYDKETKQNIKLEVNKIKFQNAKIIKNALVGSQYYVVMEANRYDIFSEKKKEFDSLDRDIDKKYQSSSSMKYLEKIGFLLNVKPSINKAKNQIHILNALNKSFDTRQFEDKYNDYALEITKEISSLVIDVNSNSEVFKKEFLSFLSKNGFKSGGNANSIITINNSNQFSKYRGWSIAKSVTSIEVKSSNKNISSNVIKSTGRSSSSKESAYVDSSRKFSNKLNKLGINKILFGK